MVGDVNEYLKSSRLCREKAEILTSREGKLSGRPANPGSPGKPRLSG